MGLTDYLQASYDEACADGKTLIGAANTLDEVVSAYNDALALIKGIPTKAELDAAKKTAIDKIAALPATTSLTSNDKDAVVDALSAYSAYVGMYGATASSIYNSYILNADLDAVLRPIGEDLQKRVDDMVKTVEKNTPANGRAITDNQAAALVALADDIGALLNEAYEFNRFSW